MNIPRSCEKIAPGRGTRPTTWWQALWNHCRPRALTRRSSIFHTSPPSEGIFIIRVAPERGVKGFYENADFKVGAARVTAITRRGGCRGQTGRRSEIGSHTHTPAPRFSYVCDLKYVMGHFNGSSGFGSHDKTLWVCRGLLTTYEKPTMNSEYEFIVATPAIFIGGGDLKKVMGHSYENGLKGHKKIARGTAGE
jgi:hypothetical protein